MDKEIDENDIQNVLHGLMEFLCENTRHNAPTDFEIEQIRIERFPTISVKDYFNRIVTIIAERYVDIELRNSMVRLSSVGLNNCEQYIVNSA